VIPTALTNSPSYPVSSQFSLTRPSWRHVLLPNMFFGRPVSHSLCCMSLPQSNVFVTATGTLRLSGIEIWPVGLSSFLFTTPRL